MFGKSTHVVAVVDSPPSPQRYSKYRITCAIEHDQRIPNHPHLLLSDIRMAHNQHSDEDTIITHQNWTNMSRAAPQNGASSTTAPQFGKGKKTLAKSRTKIDASWIVVQLCRLRCQFVVQCSSSCLYIFYLSAPQPYVCTTKLHHKCNGPLFMGDRSRGLLPNTRG